MNGNRKDISFYCKKVRVATGKIASNEKYTIGKRQKFKWNK